jgi:hypothetical protein
VSAGRRKAAALKRPAEAAAIGIEADAEARAAIKAAALYEEFGVVTNVHLEAWLWLRHRKADALFKAYGTSHTLGVSPSWS